MTKKKVRRFKVKIVPPLFFFLIFISLFGRDPEGTELLVTSGKV